MATKKRISQLESLLDWEREGGRLPETKELFNRQISPSIFLRETGEKSWVFERIVMKDEGMQIFPIHLKHTTLIQLGLSILDAVKQAEDRFIKGS